MKPEAQPYRPTETELSELWTLLKQSFKPQSERAAIEVENAVGTLVQQALADTSLIRGDVLDTIEEMIARIDEKLTAQVDEILHHPYFQELEGTWRGLWFLCSQHKSRDTITIKVLNVWKRELYDDTRTHLFSSALFRHVYVNQAATAARTPYAVILADFDFGPDDVSFQLLSQLAKVGEMANVLVVGAACPSVFGLASYRDIGKPTRIALAPGNMKWLDFRSRNESRLVSLVLPRVLMRSAYRGHEGGAYNHAERPSSHEFLWARAVWVVGDAIVRAFAQDGWFASLSGLGKDAIGELPRDVIPDYDSGGTTTIGPTEYPISNMRERELAELGFTPVVSTADGSVVVNLTLTPYQEESLDRTGLRRTHRSFAADFRGLLSACRFAHAVSRLALRSSTRGLQGWLDAFVAAPDGRPDATRPLRSASVHLEHADHDLFAATAVVSIWPAYQFQYSEPIDLRVRLDVLYPQLTEPEESSSDADKATREPFHLRSAACRESPAVLEAFTQLLHGAQLPRCQVAWAPITVDAVVDATRPIEEIVDWLCREDSRLDIMIADVPHSNPLDVARLGFLIRYSSGIVTGLSAEIEYVDGQYRLIIHDPLAVLDPGELAPTRPAAPLSYRFDILILEEIEHDQP